MYKLIVLDIYAPATLLFVLWFDFVRGLLFLLLLFFSFVTFAISFWFMLFANGRLLKNYILFVRYLYDVPMNFNRKPICVCVLLK